MTIFLIIPSSSVDNGKLDLFHSVFNMINKMELFWHVWLYFPPIKTFFSFIYVWKMNGKWLKDKHSSPLWSISWEACLAAQPGITVRNRGWAILSAPPALASCNLCYITTGGYDPVWQTPGHEIWLVRCAKPASPSAWGSSLWLSSLVWLNHTEKHLCTTEVTTIHWSGK